MNICLITSSFRGGGITSYAHEIVNSYAKGNTLSVIVGDDKKAPIDRNSAAVYYLDSNKVSISNARKLLKLINKSIKPDIIIGSNSKLLVLVAPFVNDNIRIVTVSHSLKYFEADIAVLNNKYIDKTIALSFYNKEYLKNRFNIDDNRIAVVYNFIAELPHADSILEDKKEAKVPIVVFPGGYDPPKSPDIVACVVKKLLESDSIFTFYWVGDVSFHLNRLLPFASIDIKKKLPKDKRLVFTGKLSREESSEMFAKANVFLFPSIREGCSISLLEAMRGGAIPVVADYNNGNKEMVDDGVNGFVVDHNDIDTFANRILHVINDSEKYGCMYDKSLDNWRQNYRFDVWLNNMNKIIFSSETSHCDRSGFSYCSFLKSKLCVKVLYIRSKIEIFFSERVRLLIKSKKI